MRLHDFIRESTDEIVAFSVEFAKRLPPLSGASVDLQVLRDHLPLVLDAIVLDLQTAQDRQQEIAKSQGLAVPSATETAAQTHGRLRATHGLNVEQLVAEYRVLRAVVVRLWGDRRGVLQAQDVADLVRFNEAIDQAVGESVRFHSNEVDGWRELFLASIGHDLRGPLNAVVLASDVLSARTAGSALAPQVDALQRSAKRMRELLDTLLDYNTSLLGIGMTLQPATADLAAVCREELDLLKVSLPGTQVVIAAEGDTSGTFDASRIREALANLVFNAAQYSPPQTAVHVRLDGEASRVRLCVSNEGGPIGPDELQGLFEPLRRGSGTRTHGERRNLGLGLFIVREIARAHGGDVTAAAADGRVAFTLELPKAR